MNMEILGNYWGVYDMTKEELLESITCLCVEGSEVLTKTELSTAILREIEKYRNRNETRPDWV